MKKVLSLILSLAFVGTIYSAPITLTINTDTDEVKAVEVIVIDAQEWLQAAWDGKVNKCMNRVILAESDKNPNKLTKQQKKDEIKTLTFQSRKEKENR